MAGGRGTTQTSFMFKARYYPKSIPNEVSLISR